MLENASDSQRASTSGSDGPRHGIADRLGFLLFLGALALCPLPDGSVELVWTVVWGAFASACVLMLSYASVNRASALVIAGCGGLAAAFVAVALLQSQAPGLSPQPIWQMASSVLGVDLPVLSTAVRDAPLIALGVPLVALLLFAAGVVISADGRRVERIYRVLIAIACLCGLLGLGALLFGIEALRPTGASGTLTTFFLNKNTTSTYLGSAFLMCIVLLLHRLSTALRASAGSVPSWEAIAPTRADRRVLIGLAAAVLLLGLLIPLAKSRSSLAIVVALTAVAGLVLLGRRVRSWRVVVPVVLAIFAAGYVFVGQGFRMRVAQRGFDDENRTEVYRSVIEGITQNPVLGSGLGTFPSVFPALRNANVEISGVWSMAHSTPLELALTGGLPLTAGVAAFFGLCFVLLVRGVIRRPHDPYILGALLVGVLGALHSMVDFTLQIPGYLMIYAGVTGIGVGRALRPPTAAVYEKVRRRRSVQAEPE
jgi:O-antigen ligase